MLVFCLGWLFVAALMREERTPALVLAVFCLVQVASVSYQSLVAGRESGVDGVASGLSLLTGTLADIASDLFANRRSRYLRLWLGILAAGLLVLPLARLFSDPVPWLVLGNQTVLLVQLCVPLVLLFVPLRREFGRFGPLALIPFALFTVFTAVHTLSIAIDPQALRASVRDDTQAAPDAMLPFLLASGSFHLTWFGLMVSRQVATARRLARHDALTGVLQRAAFEAELDQALALARRTGAAFSVAFLDLDHFKAINDRGGHRAGDEVLRRFADLLRASVRDCDRIGRWGGEEFVLLLPDTSETGSGVLLERLQGLIRGARVPVPPGCPPLSVSIGCTTWEGGVSDRDTLVAHADAAMYLAKSQGRNRTAHVRAA